MLIKKMFSLATYLLLLLFVLKMNGAYLKDVFLRFNFVTMDYFHFFTRNLNKSTSLAKN